MNLANNRDRRAVRWFNLQGEPTLRFKPLAPPTNIGLTHINTNVTITWSSPGRVQYYVYRSANPGGPYTLLTPVALQTTSYTTAASPTEINYLVRASQPVITGLCTYTNLSQGLFGTIP